jgi:hypothetical protein
LLFRPYLCNSKKKLGENPTLLTGLGQVVLEWEFKGLLLFLYGGIFRSFLKSQVMGKKSGKKQGPEEVLGRANRCFDKVSRIYTVTRAHSLLFDKLCKDSPPLASSISSTRDRLEYANNFFSKDTAFRSAGNFAIEGVRKNLAKFLSHQKLIFGILASDLLKEPSRTSLDIFSGMSVCPLALAEAGLVSRAHMLDGREDFHGEVSHTIDELRLGKRAAIQCLKLSLDTDPSLLPDVGHVTVIETGLSLPVNVRDNDFQLNRSIQASSCRAAHLDNTGSIGTLVSLLESNRARTMRIIDTPKEGMNLDGIAKASVVHIQQTIDEGNLSWEIDSCRVHPEIGTQFIKLVRGHN